MKSEGKPFASVRKEVEDELNDSTKASSMGESDDVLNDAASNLRTNLRPTSNSTPPHANFTWGHFFTKHCGILRENSLQYEASLIAHRIDPLDTLLESFDLMIKYGRIPIGDKLKIMKTIKKKEKDIKNKAKEREAAKKEVGLENYNDFEARIVMKYANGETEDDIDYAIKSFEDGMRELKRLVSISLLKGESTTIEEYDLIGSLARQANDPTFQFLSSFGYKTFEYYKDESVANSKVPCHSTPSNHVVVNILLGNIEDLDLNGINPETVCTRKSL